MAGSSTWSVFTPTTSAPPTDRASAALRAISSRVAFASSPMLRWAVSMASATPSPHDHTWWRNARVASQSRSAGAPGTFSAPIRGMTCAAA